MTAMYMPDSQQIETSQPPLHESSYSPEECNPELDALVTEIFGRVADKWTLIVLDVLTEHGEMRFTRLGEMVEGISQKMLTKTVRQMERDGLLTRTIHPVIPPRVEYKLTDMGFSLSEAFCGVWIWAAEHRERVQQARQKYDESLGMSKTE